MILNTFAMILNTFAMMEKNNFVVDAAYVIISKEQIR